MSAFWAWILGYFWPQDVADFAAWFCYIWSAWKTYSASISFFHVWTSRFMHQFANFCFSKLWFSICRKLWTWGPSCISYQLWPFLISSQVGALYLNSSFSWLCLGDSYSSTAQISSSSSGTKPSSVHSPGVYRSSSISNCLHIYIGKFHSFDFWVQQTPSFSWMIWTLFSTEWFSGISRFSCWDQMLVRMLENMTFSICDEIVDFVFWMLGSSFSFL